MGSILAAMAERPVLEKRQLEKLRALLAEIEEGNYFYQARLAKAGLTRNLDSLGEFTKRMGFTSKMDLVWDREEFPPYGSNLTYPLDRYSRFCQSSGTTRGPLPWIDTEESW
ncbi:MAG: phenylacetate--CoA ligase family protein, partial [Verrucomicrobiota bacterium]